MKLTNLHVTNVVADYAILVNAVVSFVLAMTNMVIIRDILQTIRPT